MSKHLHLTLVLLAVGLYFNAQAQSISIKEELKSIDTYGFGEPNPVPLLTENAEIYPYFKFEGYQQKSKKKDWKVVTLENDYIKVMVLPEIGGKIWGAIEKSTGEEFLYKNEVIKFRNIGMRGPWTSGGIEFNFGVIGHHPSTATPVDYLMRTNADGSVSCFVSNLDLPSNTKWTVEIRLEKDKAYFETNASWYNASPLTESYYNWMTGAARTSNDLEFFIPGNAYLKHNGDAHSWPIDDKDRNLLMYKNNNFGPDKSYHIVGEFNDFFGGYYHDKEFGFGQWSLYEEMPGQKLWLWSQSRSGGIWEDLLTDTDGQYIEFQAGRLFDQYKLTEAVNPISQVGFDPYVMDRWSEIWFPFKKIGGMVDASPEGVLNVEIVDGEAVISVNALQDLHSEIHIIAGQKALTEAIDLKPMDIFSKKITLDSTEEIEVYVDGTELSYNSASTENTLKRPFHSDKDLDISESEKLLFAGIETLESREFEKAHEHLSNLVKIDPSNTAALVKLAELEYRKTNYDLALEYANTVLRMDTYNSSANYMAGIIYRAKDDAINSLESLGWAARDIKYRSVAYAQIAEIYLADKNYSRAETYANKSLDFNTYGINAREVLLLLHRANNDQDAFNLEKERILSIDPLNYLVAIETARLIDESSDFKIDLNIQNEFKEETLLTQALRYNELNFKSEAILTLSSSFKSPKNQLWSAYLQKDSDPNASELLLNAMLSEPIDFIFPYRRETIPVLEWATAKNTNWKLKYYLAQNYIAVGLKTKGINILKELANEPDSPVFYRFRAKLYLADLDTYSSKSALEDLQKALDLQPNDWKVWEENILLNQLLEEDKNAYSLSKKAYKKFPKNYNIGLAYAKSLLNLEHYQQVSKILEDIQVLPYEHANESRNIYEKAYIAMAVQEIKKEKYTNALAVLEKAKKWPENIGVGKPYTPDERICDYLTAITLDKLGKHNESKEVMLAIITYTKEHYSMNSTNHLAGLLAAKTMGGSTNLVEDQLIATSTNNASTQIALSIFKEDLKATKELGEKLKLSDTELEFLQWLKDL
ncbi:DUF5107 domain-containing protein [Arenibacter sp. F26102]|uniref:DUF5107 domain-containing protein n=1 Tax=Arenibacter sp. F26102 TaxID=2926416 RepID=UPI001FF53AB4|nr:DUF5107 domain-containing protein [Arenibacter sp. F26102]MCK0147149.1 DUF5107 domain-containing protein [Arenibacter sp. F26102]